MFFIEWDNDLNGVQLTSAPTEKTLAIPPRPVFAQELDLLRMREHGWEYTNYTTPLCWAINRRYFYKGEVVMETRGGDMCKEPDVHIMSGYEKLKLIPIEISKILSKNTDFLNYLEYEALKFIIQNCRRVSGVKISNKKNPDIDWIKLKEFQETIENTPMAVVERECGSLDIMPLESAEKGEVPIIRGGKVDSIVVSFSGGKDSQVVLDLASRVIAPDLYSVAYSDTGYELPSSLQLYATTEKYYKSRYPSIKFYTVKNKQPLMYYWENMGAPSRMHRWCCSVMKTAPLYRHLKEKTGLDKQPRVLVFEGVRAEESTRRSTYLRVGKSVKHTGVINARPIFNWNSTEVYLYLFRHNLPFNNAYRQGLSRVGCVLCPYSTTWSEYVVGKNFPETMKPFIQYLRNHCKELGVKDIDDYISKGMWKTRGGGKTLFNQESSLDVSNAENDYTLILTKPKENFFEWLKTIGSYTTKRNAESQKVCGQIRYKLQGEIVEQEYEYEEIEDGKVKIKFRDLSTGSELKSVLFKVLNKTTYCVHCEACEVECPSGALRVSPKVLIDSTKCIHCLKCLTFKDKGCMMAKSLSAGQASFSNVKQLKKMNLDRYNTFGLQQDWLQGYLKNPDDYLVSDNGLNPRRQLPALKNWLREALLLNPSDLTPTPLAVHLSKVDLFNKDSGTLWQLLWGNLAKKSPICNEYVQAVKLGVTVSKKKIRELIMERVNCASERTVKNAVDALVNLIIKTPLKKTLFDVTYKGNAVESITRRKDEISLAVLAYCRLCPTTVLIFLN